MITKLEQLKKDEASFWQKLVLLEEQAKAVRSKWQPLYAELQREELREEILKETAAK